VPLGAVHCSMMSKARPIPSFVDVDALGAELERHPFFPRKASVEFCWADKERSGLNHSCPLGARRRPYGRL